MINETITDEDIRGAMGIKYASVPDNEITTKQQLLETIELWHMISNDLSNRTISPRTTSIE